MMKIMIDIDDNVYTRLFDNGIENYAIANDDLFAIAKSIRKGVAISKFLEELKRKILMEVDGGTDDKYLRCADVYDRISNSIDEYYMEVRADGDSN